MHGGVLATAGAPTWRHDMAVGEDNATLLVHDEASSIGGARSLCVASARLCDPAQGQGERGRAAGVSHHQVQTRSHCWYAAARSGTAGGIHKGTSGPRAPMPGGIPGWKGAADAAGVAHAKTMDDCQQPAARQITCAPNPARSLKPANSL